MWDSMAALTKEIVKNGNLSIKKGETLTLLYDGSFSFGSASNPFFINVESGGILNMFSYMFNIESLQFFISIELEESASCNFDSVFMRKGLLPFSGSVTLKHLGRKSVSNVHIRGILGEKAIVSYRGDVILEKGSSGAKTKIEERALLFHKEVDVNMDPTLAINEEDVSAKHAATIGSVSQNELFYIASRGVRKENAKAVLGLGFLQPVLKSVDKEMEEYINDAVRKNIISYAVS